MAQNTTNQKERTVEKDFEKEDEFIILNGQFDYDLNMLDTEEKDRGSSLDHIPTSLVQNKQNPNVEYLEQHRI